MQQKENKSKGYIKEAFMYLLCKKPVSKINVTDVIKKAGVARATFYRYFDTIDQLFNYITDSLKTILSKNLYAIIQLEDENKSKVLLRRILENIGINKRFFSNVLKENFYMLFEKMYAPAYLQETYIFKESDSIEERYCYLARAGILDIVIRAYILNKCSDNIDQMVEITMQKIKQIQV